MSDKTTVVEVGDRFQSKTSSISWTVVKLNGDGTADVEAPYYDGSGKYSFKNQPIDRMIVLHDLIKVEKPVAKKLKPKKGFKTKPLYLVASRHGMTHKGIANVVNKRGVSTFGNSVTQALSKYEDRFGKKLDLDNALVFKMVPHTIRTDKRNGRARIGRETK